MKDFNKNKELSYLKYWDVNNYMVGQCCKSFLHIILSELKNCNEESDEGYFIEV